MKNAIVAGIALISVVLGFCGCSSAGGSSSGSGGSGPYTVTIASSGAMTGESLVADHSDALSGDIVTLTASLVTGREVVLSGTDTSTSLTVSISPTIISADGGTSSFTMPAGNVTIAAVFQTAQSAAASYEIQWIEDLVAMSQDLAADYTLMRTLDFSDPDSYESGTVDTSLTTGEGFTPIGSAATFDHQDSKFSGTFDGQGYRIANLRINRPDDWNMGLFGVASFQARIHDLELVDPVVTGDYNVGSILGRVDDAYENTDSGSFILSTCSVSGGTVTGYQYTGGIVGGIDFTSERGVSFSDCTFQGGVDGENSTGGLFGSVADSLVVMSSCTVGAGSTISGTSVTGGLAGRISRLNSMSSCTNEAAVTGGDNTGGIVGLLIGDSPESTVADCVSFGDLTVDGTCGGIVGYHYNASIENCHNLGHITIADSGNGVGGIVGYASYETSYVDDDEARISSCSSSGDITQASSSGGFIGGLTGRTYISVENCYSSGTIDVNSYGQIGGLISGTAVGVRNCYTLNTITGTHSTPTVGGLIGYMGGDGSVENSIAFGDSIGSGTGTNINANLLIGDTLGTVSQGYVNDSMTISYTVPAGPNGVAGTPLSSGEFLNSGSTVYSSWDFADTWTMEAGGPELQAKTVLLDSLP